MYNTHALISTLEASISAENDDERTCS